MTPLAPYLRTPLVSELGTIDDPRSIRAFTARARNPVRLSLSSARGWAWHLWYTADQGIDSKGRPVWLRLWPTPASWYSTGRRNIESLDLRRPPSPLLLPWNKAWSWAQSPFGMNEDNGLLIDDDEAGTSGYEVHGIRNPNLTEIPALLWLTKPWLLGSPAYVPGDVVADTFYRRTPENVGTFNGRGVGREPKRKYLTTDAELADAILARRPILDHALGMVDSRIQHGPTPPASSGVGPPRCVGKGCRVEHPDRDPNPALPSPAGDVPDRYPHGTTFAHTRTPEWIESWLDRKVGVSETGRAKLRVLAETCSVRGRGARTVETGTGPDPLVETDGALEGLTEDQHLAALADLFDVTSTVVVRPAA